MDYLFKREESAGFVKVDRDLFICLVGGKSCKLTCFLGENAVAVNGTNDGDLGIIAADVVVVYTVTEFSYTQARCP